MKQYLAQKKDVQSLRYAPSFYMSERENLGF